jgi:glycosyltransferase involved in cell wall biosynthesis
MSSVPHISVIMPVYNGAAFLKEAIESILKQTFSDLELIIINDASTDGSEEIILSYKDDRIRYFKNQNNLGLIATLNLGISESRGTYIARMDQDDISLPDRFQKQVDHLSENKNVALVATKISMTNEKSEDKGAWNDDFNTTTSAEIKAYMPKLNCIAHPSIMARAEVMKKFGYSRSLEHSEDWGLWLTLLSEGYTISKIDEVLLKYRVHDTGTTVNQNKISVGKKIIRFKRKYIFGKLIRFNFKGTDKRVLWYLCIDVIKYYFPSLYAFVIKYIQTDLAELRRQKKEFKTFCLNLPTDTRSLFFFPFYHLGGAENVHLSIVKALAHTNPVVFFTNYSGSDTLLKEFKTVAKTANIDQLYIWPRTRKRAFEMIRNACEKHPDLKLFSSNSRFFYEFLPFKPDSTKAFDLIHAFSHAHEPSAEQWSLPVVQKINARVIINKQTGKDLEKQYKANNVSPELLKHIVYIPNFVEKAEKPVKEWNGPIKLLYVGRGTSEKRVHLLAWIAKELKTLNLNTEFHFAGDVGAAIPDDLKPYCILHGEIRDPLKLNVLYAQSHMLAMASTREGFPMVIMEAMMHAAIPITTNVGGISEHVNETNGILINEIQPAYFCERFINEVNKLVGNKERMKKLSDNAYTYAVKNFGKDQFLKAYKELFNG